jgi:hypothetical protein
MRSRVKCGDGASPVAEAEGRAMAVVEDMGAAGGDVMPRTVTDKNNMR